MCRRLQNRWSLLAVLVISVASTAAASQSTRRAGNRSGKRKDSEEQKPGNAKLDVGRINDPADRDPVGPHAQGDAVVRAAVLLDRLKFSPGEISDSYRGNLAKAIAAFQATSGLPAIGSMDAPTWAALNDDQAAGHVEPKQGQPQAAQPPPPPAAQPQPGTGSSDQAKNQPKRNTGQDQAGPQPNAAPSGNPQGGAQPNPQSQAGPAPQGPPPAIVPYTITGKDAAGPFTHLPKAAGANHGERTMLAEARLPRLDYASPVDELAERFHASPRLLAQLNPGKRFDKPGEEIQVPNVLTPAPPQAASVVVDASTHSVTALDGGGKALAFYPATVGSQHDPLPVGNWKIVEVRRNPKFKYNPNLFWDSENKRPRATLPPGARNPVGVVWMGLSKEHYGIHGTPDPARIGETYSHGCIRLTNWDASELASMVHKDTPVVLEEGTPFHTASQPPPSH